RRHSRARHGWLERGGACRENPRTFDRREEGGRVFHLRLESSDASDEEARQGAQHSGSGRDGADHGLRAWALLRLRPHFRGQRPQGAQARLHRGPGVRSSGVRRMVDLSVKIGSVELKNPIMPASGAFSTDIAQDVDINRLGALVAKTVSREYRIGNPPPRVAELECGMINSIGLPTKGIEYFLEHQVPDYARFTPPLVASITAVTADDFEAMTREVSAHPDVDVIEVNISCPTRNPNGGNFAMHEDHTHNVTKRIRAATNKPVWVKLSPNAGDVVAIAIAAESAGADALVVSNTILGLKINIDTFRPAIGNKFGGISGPGIK